MGEGWTKTRSRDLWRVEPHTPERRWGRLVRCGSERADQVEPRLSGGDDLDVSACGCRGGGSPLTRGRRRRSVVSGTRLRWIPAYAGETRMQQRMRVPPWVDPRLRGGDSGTNPFFKTNEGGSPLTRGRHAQHQQRGGALRWIPAYAGETAQDVSGGLGDRVDPRLRGGDHQFLNRTEFNLGGSPLTRGRRADITTLARLFGWIPAYAGETIRGNKACAATGVDPRLRGGDYSVHTQSVIATGGSPLTRGRLQDERQHLLDVRWIPAYAGETLHQNGAVAL